MWRRDGGQPDEVKMSNNNNSQRIIVPTMRKQRVASPLLLTDTKLYDRRDAFG